MINKCLNAKAFHDLQWVLCCLIRHRGLSNNLLSAFAKVLYFFLVWKVRRKEQRGSNSYFCCFLFVRHSHKWYVMKLDLKMTIHAAKPTTNWSLVMTVNMKNTFASFALIKTATKPLKELTQSWYLWSEWKCAASLFMIEQFFWRTAVHFLSLLELMQQKPRLQFDDTGIILTVNYRSHELAETERSSCSGGFKSLTWKLCSCH